MKTLLHDMEMRREGHEEGLKEGQERVNRLNMRLVELGRTEDIVRAATDPKYQEQLFGELEI